MCIVEAHAKGSWISAQFDNLLIMCIVEAQVENNNNK